MIECLTAMARTCPVCGLLRRLPLSAPLEVLGLCGPHGAAFVADWSSPGHWPAQEARFPAEGNTVNGRVGAGPGDHDHGALSDAERHAGVCHRSGPPPSRRRRASDCEVLERPPRGPVEHRRWQRQSAALILDGEARRAIAGAEHDSERHAAATRWNAAGDATRDIVAAALGLQRAEVVELLGDPLLFAAASPHTRRMVAEVLTRAVPETPADGVAQGGDQAEVPSLDVTRLPATFFSSFREALAEYGVGASRESDVLLEGLVHEQKRRAAELVGEPLRLPTLTNVPAWGPIVEKALGD